METLGLFPEIPVLEFSKVLPRTLESSILDGDLRIGDFVVRPLLKVVRPATADTAAEEKTLPDKAMAVLVYLAQHSRQVCDRDDILDAVWGPEREAYDRVLDNAIREIRRALQDDARNPTYIQTIPKKGYRLLVPVESRLLEKQRDSSGEFVAVVRDPVDHDPAQVFQRVRRGAKPDARAETRSGSETVFPGESSSSELPSGGSPGRTEDQAKYRVRLVLGALAALLLLVTVTAWWSGAFGSEHVTVSIDARALESAADGGETEPTLRAGELVAALRTALFEEHACGDKTVYRPDSWMRAADIELRLRRGDGNAPSFVTAEIEPAARQAVILSDTDRKGAPETMARQVAERLDQEVCEFARLPATSRACHCLEGSRRWASLPDSQASIEHLELATTLDPNLIPAYSALAEAFRAGGSSDAGMSVLKTGLSKTEDPDSTEALGLRLHLARLLEDPAEEERLLERLRGRNPDDMRLRSAQAYFLTSYRGQCEKSLEILKPLLAEGDRPAAVTIEAARALWQCGQKERMVDILKDQVQSLPREGELRRWLATSLSLMGQYDAATHYATESMALEPARSESYWVLGVVADRQGHYSAAEAWYQKALELARWPKQEDRVNVGFARVARLRGDFAQCAEMASEVLRPFAQSYEPPPLLEGLCLVESGRVPEAREALEKFNSTLAGPTSWAHKGLALLLQAKIEMAKATTSDERRAAASRFVVAANARPIRAAMIYSETGTAFHSIDEFSEAESWFRKALDVNPNHPWSLCRLGMLQMERGDRDAAAESMRRGLEVFGPRLEDPLAVRCADALGELDPAWTESAQIQVVTLP